VSVPSEFSDTVHGQDSNFVEPGWQTGSFANISLQSDAMGYQNKRLHFALYFVCIAAYGIFVLGYPKGGYLSPASDGGVIQYAILNNLQKVERHDFDHWRDRRIFYPNRNTLAYTEHFYLHSLIGAPYYFLTRNPEGTYVFILGIQLLIAITGFYFVAREISADLPALIASGLFFTYLPTFLRQHAQINFYGFVPWIVFFVLQFSKTGSARYIVLASLALLLQMLVGIYMELFSVVFCPLFLLIFGLYLHKKGRLRELFPLRNILVCIASGIVLVCVLFVVNKPYMDFRREIKKERSVANVDAFAPDPQKYFDPSSRLAMYPIIGKFWNKSDRKPHETEIFLGFAGIIAFLAGCLVCLGVLWKRSVSPIVSCCILFLIMMGFFSLGPYLHINGRSTGIRMPYYYLYHTHFSFHSIRVTARIVVLMSLPLSILLCWCFHKIKSLRIPATSRVLLTASLAALVLLDAYSPFYRWRYFHVHRLNYIYQRIENLPGEVLLELPSGRSCRNLKGYGSCNLTNDGFYSFMHYYHNKWTVNGNSGYVPPNSSRIIGNVDQSFDDSQSLREILQGNKIDLVLIHRKRIAPGHKKEFKIFEKKLRRFCKIVHRDDSYVLLAISSPSNRKANVPREKEGLQSGL